ncbi:SRPBCC domain-containing protein [Mesorhizobium sp. M1342]|uniref:SRPBCC family protein n=1 Tax=Mesorhizobium sp. M1342 TaxID=2957088 RepID=UPI00333D45C4
MPRAAMASQDALLQSCAKQGGSGGIRSSWTGDIVAAASAINLLRMSESLDISPITKTVVISAEPAKVWRILTMPEMIPQWMSDEELTVSLQGHAGGAIVMRGLLRGMPFENHGTIRAFVPERASRTATGARCRPRGWRMCPKTTPWSASIWRRWMGGRS